MYPCDYCDFDVYFLNDLKCLEIFWFWFTWENNDNKFSQENISFSFWIDKYCVCIYGNCVYDHDGL